MTPVLIINANLYRPKAITRPPIAPAKSERTLLFLLIQSIKLETLAMTASMASVTAAFTGIARTNSMTLLRAVSNASAIVSPRASKSIWMFVTQSVTLLNPSRSSSTILSRTLMTVSPKLRRPGSR